ncbi:probable polyol transporter 4 [Camellia sinensis]|uniref:probable polyol transporter 4 n=1 Tax=Camellia sinensis TaxID=4442 RepID=UPI00103581A6|nr:probable polyol transporter 4 [Camellia sinensis]
MGLVGLQENGNREMGLSGFPLGAKNKYRRMDSELTEDDDSLHLQQQQRNRNTKKYVLACAIFASLNSVLLGYDVGVMSGAILFIQDDLKITEVQQEVLVGSLSVVSLLAVHLNWRIMLAVGILPSVFIGFALFIIPESPRWLVMQNRVEAARTVLLKTIENESEVEERLGEILLAAGIGNAEKYEQKPVWRELLSPSPALRRMLVTGFGIQCFQQITGIDATVYYSPQIFKVAGIAGNSKLLAATVAVGVTKTAFILVAILLIDKLGRKPLLYISTIGMTICLFCLGLTLLLLKHTPFGIGMAILLVCGNVAFFSVGIGPVCWVLTSEIFPLRLRAQAAALGSVGNRVCSGLIAMSFLSMARAITVAGTFFIFSAFSAVSVAFVYTLVPETKGKSLEQIEALFQSEHERQGSAVELRDVEQLVQKE